MSSLPRQQNEGPTTTTFVRRRRLRHLLTLVGIVLVTSSLAIFWQIRVLTRVTTPRDGFRLTGHRAALLVLDVQEDYTGSAAPSPFPYPNSAALVARINELARRANAKGLDVVYVRQEFSSPLAQLVSKLFVSGTALADTFGATFDRRLDLVSLHRFVKPTADAFSSFELEAFFRERDIGEVYLAGLDGAGCVDLSARGARLRGARVTILDDVVASREPQSIAALRQDYGELDISVLTSRDLGW